MLIRTLSATRLKSYEGCPKRMLAEMRVKTSSAPGDFGSAVHAALEWFHKIAAETGTYELPNLLVLWEAVAFKYLGWTSDEAPFGEETGRQMFERWFEEHPTMPEVISQEVKETFPIATADGTNIDVTYIIDRVDADPEFGYRIIDYKSQYGRVKPDTMRSMVQPFLYACAVRRKYGVTGSIPVDYIMLRQRPQDVGILITQADMDRFERYLATKAQQILDDEDPREKLNAECGFCVRKAVCSTWSKAVEEGYSATLPLPALTAKHAEAKAAEKAAARLASEIEEAIMAGMRADKIYRLDAGDYEVEVTLPKSTRYDTAGVYSALGEAGLTYMRVGKTALDKEVNRKRANIFSESERASLKNSLVTTEGEPGIRILPKQTDLE